MKINEILENNHNLDINDIFDDSIGLGAVPDNLNVDYKGVRVKMFPSVFLKLATKVKEYKSKEYVKNYILKGGKIGHPFLIIKIPYSWKKYSYNKKNEYKEKAMVVGHEGRNRVSAIKEIFGDKPIEVHLFFVGYRNMDIKEEWLKNIDKSLISQDGEEVKNIFL